jgi:hypothetical protein
MCSYAVVWQQDEGPSFVGKVELMPRFIRLEGAEPHGLQSLRKVRYGELAGVHVERGSRHAPALVLDREDGGAFHLRSIGSPGVLGELAEGVLAHLPANTER